jgi:hypothetical protein
MPVEFVVAFHLAQARVILPFISAKTNLSVRRIYRNILEVFILQQIRLFVTLVALISKVKFFSDL